MKVFRSYDVCPAMCALAMNRRIDISLPDIKKAVAKQAEDPFGVPTLTPDQFRTFCKYADYNIFDRYIVLIFLILATFTNHSSIVQMIAIHPMC